MAIDTLRKRRAVLSFGRRGTRQPEGATSAFLRGSGLGCYSLESVAVTDPNEGWIARTTDRHWTSQSRDRHWIAPVADRLWIAPKQEPQI